MESYFYPPEQHKRNCGMLVARTLQSIGGKGTANDLLDGISCVIGQPEEIVKPELKQVLRQAVREGFLIRNGKKYSYPTHEYEYEVDTLASKRGNAHAATRSRIDRDRKAIASKSQNKRRKLKAMNKSKSKPLSPRTRSRSKSRSSSK